MNKAEERVRRVMARAGETDEDLFRAQISLVAQNEAIKTLLTLNRAEAIGAACAFLLRCAQSEPVMFRRVMNERVIRDGFSGISLLDVFKRVCQ